jgi:ribosomal protein L35
MAKTADATSANPSPATEDEDNETQELPADDAVDGDENDDVEPEGVDSLGDPGKRALDSMKSKWHTERKRRRDLETELEKLRNGANRDDAPDAETIRQQAEQAATSKANARIVRSEIRAAAAGKLNDPKDALTFLNLDQFEVDENGEVDTDEIADAIDDLLKRKPYLAAATAKRFQGTGDGGAAARKPGKPKQLTEADLKTMTAEQIVKAQDEGRLNDLLGAG